MKKILVIVLGLSLGVAQADPIQDLYVEIMPEKYRLSEPQKTYKSFKAHLLDTYAEFPAFATIQKSNLAPIAGMKSIIGKITYVMIFKKAYKYDVSLENGVYVFKVRIHLKNPTLTDISEFTDKIKQAEKEWNDYRVGMDFLYEFRFDLETDIKKAHFSVNVLNSTRGPYDTNWGRDWDSRTISHEVGHMMGLGDEYQTLTSQNDCVEESKMCHQYGKLWQHHYYFVLRRLLK